MSGLYGPYIEVLFGANMQYFSFLLLQGLFHVSHRNLLAKKSIFSMPLSKLVINMRLLNKNSLEIEYYDIINIKVIYIIKKFYLEICYFTF